MKFRFCGDCDCPEWVLAEIHSSLSMLTSVKLKILTQLVACSILGDEVPEVKLKSSFMTNKNDLKSIKSAMACIRFLLVNATRFRTDETTFSTELQQLGLPQEHSSAICRVFKEQSGNIQEYLTKNSLTVNELIDMTFDIPSDAINCACITFKLKNEIIDGVPTETSHEINIERSDVRMLLKEMKTVRSLMDETE
ncbi:COMM domain-containing protein 4 [Sitodiplosis mosellana]|uniref:COMM domain-containing protein 4 n=1 Tax=Sitodiplosis mosellana TaxID=263140 RepID=UPI00244493CE|nr:COMM domain-containing protein 4 [Sitodiplosis mosellana]